MPTSNHIYRNNREINHFFRRNDSITLEQLKNFIAIYELGNFSKAAEATHKTQPAVSHNLAKLEEKLNAQLVIRNRGTGINFTEEGHRFYREIAPLIDQLLIKIDENESKNAITIGVPDDLDMRMQLHLYKEISAITDNRLRILCGFSNRITQMVEDGRISFGLVKRSAKAGNFRYGWVGDREIDFQQYQKLPLVAGYSGCIIRDLVENSLNHVGKDFFFVYISGRIFHRIEAVKAGLGVGVFSEERIHKSTGLVRLGEPHGFPALSGFNYHAIGKADTAQKNKILPLLKNAADRLNQ